MKKTINQEKMRANNKRSILEYIQKHTPTAKQTMVRELGLSSTSVATFINELIAEGLVMECGIAKSTGGRRSILYQLKADASYLIGIDLQIDRIIAVLSNFNGILVLTKEFPLATHDEWQVANSLSQCITELVSDSQIPFEKIKLIGIGIPGIVQSKTGIIKFAPNLGWRHVNLAQLLPFEIPIIIENEAKAAALGEQNFGIAKQSSNLIYVSVGVGIGCGLVLEGKLFNGHSFNAGEFGHMVIENEGLPCRCGNQGCWEAYAANEASLRRYNHKAEKKISTYDEFIQLILQKEPLALEVLEFTIKYLGLGIANLVNGFNPEIVVIGGKIVELKEIIYQKLLKEVKSHCLEQPFRNLTLEFSQLKNQASALGMISKSLNQLISELPISL